MRRFTLVQTAAIALICGVLTSLAAAADSPAKLTWPAGLPVYDHVVIVVEENKDYDHIIGSSAAHYINTVLKAEGASFTRMYGEEHHSQGNYYWLFSGSNQSVGFSDHVPDAKNNAAYPFQTGNLGQQLIAAGKTFKGYCEDLPSIGYTGHSSPNKLYARKHAPWISFANVPNGTTAATSSNLRFADFPTDFRELPTVSIVIPNLDNDMHNGILRNGVAAGDRWLKKHLDAYYQWAKQNNSLLILTFDENDDQRNLKGLTDPFVPNADAKSNRDIQNRVATIFAGAHVKAGEYAEGQGITHVNLLRTLEAMYGLPKSGAQQPHAARGGITDDFIVTDVFQTATK